MSLERIQGETHLEDVELFSSKVYSDDRGWFKENCRQTDYTSIYNFVQENVSKSDKGVLRGLHIQKPYQGKLVTVLNGAVLDVIIDMRPDSNTYLESESFLLTEENGYSLFVPEGYAHGFLSLEYNTVFSYKCTNYYNPKEEYTLKWDDPSIVDLWYKTTHDRFVLNVSDKDKDGMSLDELKSAL